MSDQIEAEDTGPSVPLTMSMTLEQAKSEMFYFYHAVSPSSTALIIQTLGPNMTFKFTHRKARRILSASTVMRLLETKTVGFLTMIAKDGRRVVLASAESGHGGGKYGDLLDKSPGVLPNKIWARRVVQVGKILGLSMDSPFDGMGRRATEELRGLFLGSHVEVKLAVHAAFVLLNIFDITKDFDNISHSDLKKLRRVKWEDGTRPVFEVYFSRKNCKRCGLLARKLEELTGVTIRFCWRHRLEMKKYIQRPKPICSREGQPRDPLPEIDDQDIDFGDEMEVDEDASECTAEEDCMEIEVVDLTDVPSSSPPCESCPPSSPVDDYIDGLAYRVGQMDSSPDGAIKAIVEFAHKMRKLYAKRAARAERLTTSRMTTPRMMTPNGRNINKPLPATPVTEEPVWEQIIPPREVPHRSGSPKPKKSNVSRWARATPSRGGRAPLRDTSPRRYASMRQERTALSSSPPRHGGFRVEVPPRRAST